ncbi:MAG: hypothetical protein PVG78_05690 [Desulfobacterales bacterium]|jgi:hypothetical protein
MKIAFEEERSLPPGKPPRAIVSITFRFEQFLPLIQKRFAQLLVWFFRSKDSGIDQRLSITCLLDVYNFGNPVGIVDIVSKTRSKTCQRASGAERARPALLRHDLCPLDQKPILSGGGCFANAPGERTGKIGQMPQRGEG